MERAYSKFNFKNMIRGILVSLCITFVLILAFALTLKFLSANDLTIKIINQGIKIISIFFGVNVCLKKDPLKRGLKGIIIGASYTFLSYFIFSLLSSTFGISLSFLYDLIFGSIIGFIVGALKR